MKAMVALFAAAALLFPALGRAQQPEKRPAAADNKKPTVLVIYADWCPICQKLKPVISAVADKYKGRIRFVRYDITSKSTEAESRIQAERLGFEEFFAKNRESTSLVVILNSTGHEELRTHGDYEPEHYEAVLDRLLAVAGR
jgi:thiol-disulfide isomerase/thioredoxin